MILKFLVMFHLGLPDLKNDPVGEEGNKWGNIKDTNQL
jgi:hypothetical protein